MDIPFEGVIILGSPLDAIFWIVSEFYEMVLVFAVLLELCFFYTFEEWDCASVSTKFPNKLYECEETMRLLDLI